MRLDEMDDKWGVFGGTTPRQRKQMRNGNRTVNLKEGFK